MECLNELSAHLAVRYLDVTLPRVPTTCYCIPKEWLTVQIRFVALYFPLILGMKVLHVLLPTKLACVNTNEKMQQLPNSSQMFSLAVRIVEFGNFAQIIIWIW